jgi:dolichol-phosphate mannosyltransferase
MADSRGVDLTIALPAYREGESLRELLPAICAELSALGIAAEVVVVDSAEPLDDTAEICRQNAVRHVARRGGERYGDAIRTAVAEANGGWLLIMDADGSHPAATLGALWANRAECDLVIGSRYVAGGRTGNPLVLVGMSLLLNFAFRAAFSLRCRDVTNSLRLYRLSELRSLTLESNDFDILQEILIKFAARRPPAVITEIPMTFLPRKAGESKRQLIPFIITYLRTMARLWRFRRTA